MYTRSAKNFSTKQARERMQIHLLKFCNFVLLSMQFVLQQACMNGDYTSVVQIQGLWDIHA